MPLPDITLQISSGTVAWYGAVIATIAMIVSVRNVWKDRPRVILEFGRNFRRIETWHEPFFYISVVNRGRRPVRIDKAWVKVYGCDGKVLLADSVNTKQERTLDERNPKITFWSPERGLEIDNIYRIYASDDTGKVYKKYIKSFPTFVRARGYIRAKQSVE